MGAYGNERTQQSLQDFPVVDSEEEEEKVHLKQYQVFKFVAECVFWSQSALLSPLGNKMFLIIFVGISEGVGSVAKGSCRLWGEEETKVFLQNYR